ncbi:MAG: hypothetical protein R2879_15675 [Saprospiraceae bacterium]
MKNSDLILTLQSLDKQDIRNLKKFIQSPFFNQREDVWIAFEFLTEELAKSNPNLKKTALFDVVYPFEKFDDKKLRYLMSFLQEQILQYFSILEFQEQAVETNLKTLKQLRKRGLEKIFLKELKKTEKQQLKSSAKSSFKHLHQFQIETEQYQFTHQNRRFADFNIENIPQELTNFYLAELFLSASIALSHQAVSKKEYDIPFLKEAISYVEQNEKRLPISVLVHYKSYLALAEPANESHFRALKDMLQGNTAITNSEELRDILILLINICIKRLNSGEKHFLKEAFDLYKLGLDNKVLYIQNELPIFTFNNIVNIGLGLQQFDWVKDFIENNHKFLPAQHRENAYQYNLANYYLRTEQFDQAQEILSKVILKDTLYNIDSRRILLKIYFEKGETEALYSLIASFKVFLQRKKDLGYHREMYQNLLSFLEKFLHLKPGETSKKEKLLEKIKSTQRLAERDWLIGIVEGLKG